MNIDAVLTLMSEARRCAFAMLENANFIQQELPKVHMDEATRASAVKLCSQLIGTKHDIIHEVSELDELIRDRAPEDRIDSVAVRIVQWLWADIAEMHKLVRTLEAAAQSDPQCGSAYILVAESAVNILIPFNRAKAAADLISSPYKTGNA